MDSTDTDLNWPETVRALFEPDGWLVTARMGSQHRPGQSAMAHAVAQSIEQGEKTVIEAGTGTGKTFAYLLPVLLSGKKTLISTATRNLQDQLFHRDLPELVKLLGLPVKLALLKGRSAYVCDHRLGKALSSTEQRGMSAALRKVAAWAAATGTGDLSELSGLAENSPLMPWITSTRDNCVGSECAHHAKCHVNRARRDAMAADVTVINHHLYFSDLIIRHSGQGQLLPDVDVVVFDEAHTLVQTGVDYLGVEFGSHALLELARDALVAGLEHAAGFADWRELSQSLEQSVRDWRLSWPYAASTSSKQAWQGELPADVDAALWHDTTTWLRATLSSVVQACATSQEVHPDLQRLHERAQALRACLDMFGQACPQEHVRWSEVGRGVRLVQSPLYISQWMNDHVWQDTAAPKTFVFTSATLAQGDGLAWFSQSMGLPEARTLQLPSPFDYPRQAFLHVPKALPTPGSDEHSAAVARLSHQVASALGGRTLVLTTSLRAMKFIAQQLRHLQDQAGSWQVLCQGEAPKAELIQRFRDSDASGLGAVLVGSASFWEGVDIPGDALSCVVIDKLPFPSPGDPWTQAMTESMKRKGQDPFKEHSLPLAALSLKQGAGRLIRHEQDRGLLVIADPRVWSKSYGKTLLAALPPMRRVENLQEALSALRASPEFPPGLG